MKKTYHASRQYHHPPPHSPREPHAPPSNSRPIQYTHRRFPANLRLDRPPGPTAPPARGKFVVNLLADRRGPRCSDVDSLISQCKPSPDSHALFQTGGGGVRLFFFEKADAVQAVVNLWDSRFEGVHCYVPCLARNHQDANSAAGELEDRLRALFADRVDRLTEGEEVKKWRKKLQSTLDEINDVSYSLGRRNNLGVCQQLCDRKKGLSAERDLIGKRLGEFKSAMNCIQAHLEGNKDEVEGVQVLKFGASFDWNRIYCLISRERRRLEDGLPIYAYRRDILQQIHLQQWRIFHIEPFGRQRF